MRASVETMLALLAMYALAGSIWMLPLVVAMMLAPSDLSMLPPEITTGDEETLSKVRFTMSVLTR